jgi:predicted DNA-binding transcriptional regulator YafY
MDRFERLYKLYRALRARRYPVSRETLQQELECSEVTIKRDIGVLRNLGAPIPYDRGQNGYYLDRGNNQVFEVPGLWFTSSELYALLTSYKLLFDVQPGWLSEYITPIIERLQELLDDTGKHHAQIQQRIRILQIAARPANLEHFQQAVAALIERKQLQILYPGREKDKTTERTVSPQRLVYSRNNWYLDAWCHMQNGLRTFSIDRLHPVVTLEEATLEISDADLDAHYARNYGIFAGPAPHTAVLLFSADAARWVADEHWHPQQRDQVLPDGRYELRVPYGDPRELIMDILKYGPDVEVLEPPELRKTVALRLKAALQQYS